MSTGALENKPLEKSGRAEALPAPPPPQSLPGDLRFFFSLPSRFVQMLDSSIYQAPVVQKVIAQLVSLILIRWIVIYPVNSAIIGFPNTYPLDSDLSGE